MVNKRKRKQNVNIKVYISGGHLLLKQFVSWLKNRYANFIALILRWITQLDLIKRLHQRNCLRNYWFFSNCWISLYLCWLQIRSQLWECHWQELKRNRLSVKISLCIDYFEIYFCHKGIQIAWVMIIFIINFGTRFKHFAQQ